MTATWRISASSAAPGWLGMPPLGADDAGWVDASTAALRAAFGDRWSADLDSAVPALLQLGLDRREDDDLLSWLLWPVALPVFAVVRARVVDSAALPDFHAAGASVQPVESGTLGPGILVTARVRLEEADASAALAVLAFDDGDAALALSIDPTVAEVVDLSAPALRDLADRVELERPDGSAFRARPPAGIVAAEAWSLGGAA
ncbi:hypothetical protein [Agrococcus sp. HG114]|uniref:hypothetical protein n=1 Tax=Agrococcus sp. HG114 TaxID=2969757 RepID=UPI00215B44EF|nr:hypothetical protein [Agrococcus sp. HG114]MCR8671471.1 hypothetical protein [Agrococcus sp. HG114]